MEIREPKFKHGERVIDKKGNVGTVIKFNSYRFDENEYLYDVSYDGEKFIKTESFLEHYPKNVWELQRCDTYYVIDYDVMNVRSVIFFNDAVDLNYRALGNCFLTREEAEFEVERRRIETEMIRLGGRRVFKKGERNWYIRYNFYTDSVDVDYNMYETYGRGIMYFDSEEKAKEIIKTISEDKIRKYIFGAD